MARIAGVDFPRNKHIGVALRYIYGVGPTNSLKILAQAGIDPELNSDALNETQVNRIREIIDKEVRVEGELRREINQDIKRLIEIGSYRGLRHRRNLPRVGSARVRMPGHNAELKRLLPGAVESAACPRSNLNRRA